jgi:FkbH-like protein
LFEPRKDGNCRRFVDGVVPIDGLISDGYPVVEITFKRWANMFAKGPATLLPTAEATWLEESTRRWSDILRRLPDGGIHVNGWPGPLARVARRLRRSRTERSILAAQSPPQAEAFIATIYVPGETSFDATLSVSNGKVHTSPPYQKRLVLDRGFHQVKIDISEIAAVIGDGAANFVSLIPNTEGNSAHTIYLGFMGFVSTAVAKRVTPVKLSKSIKVMVWDLDHTIWDGILVEDGVENLNLRLGVAEILKKLDSLGIVNSIASKNDIEPALAALKRFGIEEYFVFPQISWGPKSQALKQIIADFNIGADTVAFIDDQPFERSEVESVLPEVRTYDAADYKTILDRIEFNPEVSSESSTRRLHYINEGARRAIYSTYQNEEYEAFLRDCNLQMQILQGEEQNIDRIYELTQRTNQMNFSGTRYTREEIVRILGDSTFDAFSLRCQDKFGDYGTVGFGLVAIPLKPSVNPQVIDLAFSCRVQSKRAEHAFFAWLGQTYKAKGMDVLEVRYIPTARNKAVAAVFVDMGFERIAENADGYRIMKIDTDQLDVSAYPWTIAFEERLVVKVRDAG